MPATQGCEGRRDGKVTLGTANVQQVTSSSVFRGCQDSRVSLVPMASQAEKGSQETPARMASLGSQGSRVPQAVSEPQGPREQKAMPGQSPPKGRRDSLASPACLA